MKKGKDIMLTKKIEANFGSDFQEEVHQGSLDVMILIWCQHVKNAHKKNKIWINGEEVK